MHRTLTTTRMLVRPDRTGALNRTPIFISSAHPLSLKTEHRKLKTPSLLKAPSKLTANKPRRAFTLIELLIVVTIISVLAALTMRVVGSMVDGARKRATQATMKKIQGILEGRIASFGEFNFKNKIDAIDPVLTALNGGTSTTFASLANSGGPIPFGMPAVFGQSTDLDRAVALAAKGLFRGYFPQTWAEAQAYGLTAQANETVPGAIGLAESAEVLYFVINKAAVFGSTPVGAGEFTAAEVMDTDGNGKLEFVDAWKQPLRFYRWPTRLIQPNGFGTGTGATRGVVQQLIYSLPAVQTGGNDPLMLDPDDPLDTLNPTLPGNATWATNHGITAAGFEGAFHTLSTWHIPLVVSLGPDGVLGLFEPGDTADLGNLAMVNPANAGGISDNITNLNFQAGGR